MFTTFSDWIVSQCRRCFKNVKIKSSNGAELTCSQIYRQKTFSWEGTVLKKSQKIIFTEKNSSESLMLLNWSGYRFSVKAPPFPKWRVEIEEGSTWLSRFSMTSISWGSARPFLACCHSKTWNSNVLSQLSKPSWWMHQQRFLQHHQDKSSNIPKPMYLKPTG